MVRSTRDTGYWVYNRWSTENVSWYICQNTHHPKHKLVKGWTFDSTKNTNLAQLGKINKGFQLKSARDILFITGRPWIIYSKGKDTRDTEVYNRWLTKDVNWYICQNTHHPKGGLEKANQLTGWTFESTKGRRILLNWGHKPKECMRYNIHYRQNVDRTLALDILSITVRT